MSVIQQIKDENGNIVYEEHDTGYKEWNKYNAKGKLIESRQQYPNGLIETERFNDNMNDEEA